MSCWATFTRTSAPRYASTMRGSSRMAAAVPSPTTRPRSRRIELGPPPRGRRARSARRGARAGRGRPARARSRADRARGAGRGRWTARRAASTRGRGEERPAQREHLALAAGERAALVAPALVEPREEAEHVVAREDVAAGRIGGRRAPARGSPRRSARGRCPCPRARGRARGARARERSCRPSDCAVEPHLARDARPPARPAGERVDERALAGAVGARPRRSSRPPARRASRRRGRCCRRSGAVRPATARGPRHAERPR